MRCIDCDCCKKGWFKSMPEECVCIGVKVPFLINNIYHECTQYPEKRNKIGIKEAIDYYKYGIDCDIFSEPVTTYAKMALEALEKQIPNKVVDIHKSENPDDIEYNGEDTLYGNCPNCGELITDLWNTIYCGDCGQKLDWRNDYGN